MKERLRAFIDNQPISDTHEHIISSATLAKHRRGLVEFIGESYLHDDIIASGGTDELFTPGEPDTARWKRLRPYLDRVRNTSYYRCLPPALNDLFGLDFRDIDDESWAVYNEKLLEAGEKDGEWYEFVLREKGKLSYIMLDMDRTTNTEVGLWQGKGLKSIQDTLFEPRFFTRVARTDLLLNTVYPRAREEIGCLYGLELKGIDELDELVDRFVGRAREQRAVTYKSVAAYFRTLSFPAVSREKAGRAYAGLVRGTGAVEDERAVQNYILHKILAAAEQNGMPIQFHTGMQALNANTVQNSNPLLLNDLLLRYPGVRFTLLHGGYPFCAEAGVLAKKFPNVNLDCSWLPQIGFHAAKHALEEWLDTVPMSKITWGGDCRHVENAYSAVLLFRELLQEVLGERLEKGWLDEQLAFEIARKIMYDNAVKIYRLDSHTIG